MSARTVQAIAARARRRAAILILVAVGGAAAVAAACADRIAGPAGQVFAIPAAHRTELASVLRFTVGEAIPGETRDADQARAAAALERVAEGIDANDADGTRAALAEARALVTAWRSRAAADPVTVLGIERVMLVLEHVSIAVAPQGRALYVSGRTDDSR